MKRIQWYSFVIAGLFAGVAGALFSFAKGSISPEAIHVMRSIDALVMVLLGGLQTLVGPLVGASVFVWLQDTIVRQTEFWRAVLGGIILLLVLAFPVGLAGVFRIRSGRRPGADLPQAERGARDGSSRSASELAAPALSAARKRPA